MIMDSFTQIVFEYECNFSLIATLSSGILAYSELFIPFLRKIKFCISTFLKNSPQQFYLAYFLSIVFMKVLTNLYDEVKFQKKKKFIRCLFS